MPTTYFEGGQHAGEAHPRTRLSRAARSRALRSRRHVLAGYKLNGRWYMQTLDADTLTEARRERESILAGLREGRIAAPDHGYVRRRLRRVPGGAQPVRPHPRARAAPARPPPRRSQAPPRPGHHRDRCRSACSARLGDKYSPWTCVAVYRLLVGTFALAVRRGILTRNPIDGLAPSERPKQRNAKRVAVLDADVLAKLVAAGSSERWRAALGLAGYAGLRLGEIRGLRWADVDREAGTVASVARYSRTAPRRRRRPMPAPAPCRCCRRFAVCSWPGRFARRTSGRTTSSSAPPTGSSRRAEPTPRSRGRQGDRRPRQARRPAVLALAPPLVRESTGDRSRVTGHDARAADRSC